MGVYRAGVLFHHPVMDTLTLERPPRWIPEPAHPASKLTPSAARILALADEMEREGETEIAARVRRAAGGLEWAPLGDLCAVA